MHGQKERDSVTPDRSSLVPNAPDENPPTVFLPGPNFQALRQRGLGRLSEGQEVVGYDLPNGFPKMDENLLVE